MINSLLIFAGKSAKPFNSAAYADSFSALSQEPADKFAALARASVGKTKAELGSASARRT